jgi:hypothetical protein
MRSVLAGLRTLVLPWGAAPGTPRRVIGTAVPAELVAYFAAYGAGYQIIHADLWYFDGDDYFWEALLNSHVGDAFERAHPSGFTIGGVVYFAEMVNFDITGGNLVRVNVGTSPDVYEQVFGSGASVDVLGPFRFDGISAPRGYRDANSTDNGTVATSVAGAEAAVPSASWDSEPTFTFVDGRLYAVDVTGATVNAAATAQTALVRIRKGSGTIVGTQLWLHQEAGPAGFGGQNTTLCFTAYVKNTSGADVNTDLSLTIQRVVGAANYSLFGTAGLPLVMAVRDIGTVANQPGLAAIATSV